MQVGASFVVDRFGNRFVRAGDSKVIGLLEKEGGCVIDGWELVE